MKSASRNYSWLQHKGPSSIGEKRKEERKPVASVRQVEAPEYQVVTNVKKSTEPPVRSPRSLSITDLFGCPHYYQKCAGKRSALKYV